MSSQFRFPSLQKRKVKKHSEEKIWCPSKPNGSPGFENTQCKSNGCDITSHYSNATILSSHWKSPGLYHNVTSESLAFSSWRISTSFLNTGANLAGLTAPGPDLFNLATQQEQCCQSEMPLALIPRTYVKGQFCPSALERVQSVSVLRGPRFLCLFKIASSPSSPCFLKF